VLPLLVAAVKASTVVLAGQPLADALAYLNLLIVYDVIFIAVAFMIFDFVVEE